MARAAKMARSGPGYVGLIVFIVLCLVLIAGYVVLFPAYAKRGSDVMQMNKDINENLEKPLGTALNISATPTVNPAERAYDLAFFGKVRDAALKGIKYDEMSNVTGYGGESPLADIDAELAKLTPKPATLREELSRLRLDITTLQGRLNDANTALDAAKADRDNAQKAKVAAEGRLKEALDAKSKDIEDVRKKSADEVADLKSRWQKADAAEKKARADAAADATQLKKQISDLNENIKALEQKSFAMQEELNRKKPKPIPVLEGTVLRANLSEGNAHISLGSNQGIKVGEKFTVMAVGKRGVRVTKGEVEVVSVSPEISRVDIIGPAFETPILAGDIVVRQKTMEEASDSAAAAK